MLSSLLSSVLLPVVLLLIVCYVSIINTNRMDVVDAFIPTRRLQTLSSSFAFQKKQCCMFHPNQNQQHQHQLYSRSSSTTTTNGATDTSSIMDTIKEKRGVIIVAGATGYIGKAVVRECLRQNYITFALVRNLQNTNTIKEFTYESNSAIIVQCDVTNQHEIQDQVQEIRNTYCDTTTTSSKFTSITAMVSCLASRSGIQSDSYNIDYLATLHCLYAAKYNHNVQHFILLSAFCVQKPILQFQQGNNVYYFCF
jgi:hypothetical protein